MIEIIIAALVVLSIVVFVISRRSVTRADNTGASEAGSMDGRSKSKGANTGVTLFEGTYEGYPYVVEELKNGQATVWMEPPGPVTIPFIAVMQNGEFKVNCESREVMERVKNDPDLQELVKKGATYVDLGLNVEWLIAVLPRAVVSDSRESVEKICGLLLRLDKKFSHE
ncbi:MAG: hypothetical protein OEV59_04535 [Deltaproteobacteria bacterium]|nr:hypothetical protein [Deltaproteobacteria bacterium]